MNRLNRVILVILFGVFSGCSVYIDDFDVDENSTNQSEALNGSDPANTSAAVGIIDCNHEAALPSGDALTFCAIESGSFEMGCDPEEDSCQYNELPLHTVSTTAFEIQQFEVTNGAYQEFIAAEPAWAPDGEQATSQCDSAYLKSWRDNVPSDGLLKPVLGVCWYAADAFCRWLGQGFRLPTEAEWERVARGTEDGMDSQQYRVYPFSDLGCAAANYSGCEDGPTNVGSRNGVAFGQVFDMGGNAWELVADWYSEFYYCDPLDEGYLPSDACNTDYAWKDPTGPQSGESKVVRGGSWFHDAEQMRNAKRERLAPEFSSNIAGFRCASD